MSRSRSRRLKQLLRLSEVLHLQTTSAVAELNRERDAISASFEDAKSGMDDASYIGGAVPAHFTARASRLVVNLEKADVQLDAGIFAALQSLSSVNGLRRRMVEAHASEARAAGASALDDAIDMVVRTKGASQR